VFVPGVGRSLEPRLPHLCPGRAGLRLPPPPHPSCPSSCGWGAHLGGGGGGTSGRRGRAAPPLPGRGRRCIARGLGGAERGPGVWGGRDFPRAGPVEAVMPLGEGPSPAPDTRGPRLRCVPGATGGLSAGSRPGAARPLRSHLGGLGESPPARLTGDSSRIPSVLAAGVLLCISLWFVLGSEALSHCTRAFYNPSPPPLILLRSGTVLFFQEHLLCFL